MSAAFGMTELETCIVAIDVAYSDTHAAAASVLFEDWNSGEAVTVVAHCEAAPVAEYEPGAFYKRELPHLLGMVQLAPHLHRLIIVDGYVWLSADGRPGLGAHLYNALGASIPVIGVAKTRFRDDDWSAEVLRGESKEPLFVTAAGIALDEARDHIKRMHGAHRIPTMLKLADTSARELLAKSVAAPK